MIRLFLIDWIKIRSYRSFQILTGLYFIVVGFVCCSGPIPLNFLKNKGFAYKGIDPTMLPIYSFTDVWQNMTFVAARLKIFLAFIVIISLTNEITYKTLRQNIIDGLNRADFMISKFSMILVFSIANTILVFLLGLIMGLIYSHDTSISAIFCNIQFLGAFFLNVFAFLVFAFLIGLLIKRTGIVIVFLGLYSVFVEPITTLIMTEAPKLKNNLGLIAPYFPNKAIRDLIHNPFLKYAFQEIQDYVSYTEVSVVIVQLLFYFTFIYMLLKWRSSH
jgi:ABC-2 type transport system permease protein